MLVEISPWRSVKTSIPTSKKKQARIEASFVVPRKQAKSNSKKARRSSAGGENGSSISNHYNHNDGDGDDDGDGNAAIVGLTSDNQITFVGRQLKTDAMAENFDLQFSARPGGNRGYFPQQQQRKNGIKKNGTSSSFHSNGADNDLPSIPALYDPRTQHMIALQNSNRVLCVWQVVSGSAGRDDQTTTTTTIRHELQSPIVSMALLPSAKGLVFGSCQDGSLFHAQLYRRMDQDDLQVAITASRVPSHAVHLGTVGEGIPEVMNQGRPGRKRKSSMVPSGSPTVSAFAKRVNFYQLYASDKEIIVIKHHTERSKDDKKKFSVTQSTTSSTSIQIIANDDDDDVMDKSSIKLLASNLESPCNVTVLYRRAETSPSRSQQQPQHKNMQFASSISMSQGRIKNEPTPVPVDFRCVGMISETVMVKLHNARLQFVDVLSSAVLRSVQIDDAMVHESGGPVVFADPSTHRIAIVGNAKGQVGVLITTASFSNEMDQASAAPVSLADRLQLHLESANESIVSGGGATATAGPDTMQDGEGEGTTSSTPASLLGDYIAAVASGILAGEYDFDKVDEAAKMALSKLQRSESDSNSSSSSSLQIAMVHSQRNPQDDDGPSDAMDIDSNGNTAGGHNGINGVNNHHHHVRQKKSARMTKDNKADETNKNKGSKDSAPNTTTKEGAADPDWQIINETIAAIKMVLSDETVTEEAAHSSMRLFFLLLETTRVSARVHLDGRHESGIHDLQRMLNVYTTSSTGPKQATMALMVMFSMLSYCIDVSEAQMVVMLDYICVKATDDDIKSFLQYLKDQSALSDAGAAAGIVITDSMSADAARAHLIRIFAECIAAYSKCNEPILRSALAEHLSHGTVACVLAKVFLSMVKHATGTTTDVNKVVEFRQQRHKSITIWLTALAGVYNNDMKQMQVAKRTSLMQHIQKTVRLMVHQSEAIISLQDDILFYDTAERGRVAKKKATTASARSRGEEETLVGYTIERLIF